MSNIAPFRYEREMYPALGSALRDAFFPAGQNAMEIREPSICGVIPDVLFCHWRVAPLLKITRPATIIDAHVLSALERAGPYQTKQLCESLFLSEAKAHESISRLVRRGLVVTKRNGQHTLATGASGKQVSLIAVELKMSRWREALDQARSYLRFADASFVVLDGGKVTLTPAIDEAFLAAGIGLFLQHGSAVQIRVKARRFPYIPTPERYIAMHKACLLIDYNPAYPRHFLNALSQTC